MNNLAASFIRFARARAIYLFCACFFVWVMYGAGCGFCSSEKAGSGSGIEAIEETIKLLDDTEELGRIKNQLRILAEAKKASVSAEQRPAQGPEILNILSAVSNKAGAFYDKASEVFSLWRTKLAGARGLLADEEFMAAAKKTALRIIAALLALLVFAAGARALISYMDARFFNAAAIMGKYAAALRDIVIHLLILSVLYAVCWIILAFLYTSESAALRLLAGVCAGFIALRRAAAIVFSPDNDALRLVHVQSETAAYCYVWIIRILNFSFLMTAGYLAFSSYGFSAAAAFFMKSLQIGLLIMAAVILAQRKESFSRALHIAKGAEEKGMMGAFKTVLNAFFTKVYIIVILFSVFVACLRLFEFNEAASYLLGGAFKSTLVFGLLYAAFRVWDRFYAAVFQVSDSIKARYPRIENQVNRYISWVGKGVRVLLFASAGILLCHAWGLNAAEFLSSNSSIVLSAFRIPVIVITVFIVNHALGFFVEQLQHYLSERRAPGKGHHAIEVRKQVETVGAIIKKTASVAAWVVAGIMILKELGFNVAPLIAGAGIVGLAVGFGAQNLVRDFITGLFMIIENQIRVGDVVILNGEKGLVESINLRTTVIRGMDGTVHIFPNGTINSLSNMTLEFSYYVFDIGVAYKEDVDRVMAVLNDEGEKIRKDSAFSSLILEPLDILGVDQFSDSAVVIKARFKTVPQQQWIVGREMNRRIKIRFDKEGIEIPFPHRTIYLASKIPQE